MQRRAHRTAPTRTSPRIRAASLARRLTALAAIALLLALHAAAPSATAQDPPNPAATAAATPALAAAPAGRVASNLAIITIRTQHFDDDPIGDGMIDNVTARSVARRIAQAEQDGADAIAFEIDTPGGLGIAALDITEAIRSTSLYTIAWINTQAISAGAFIALACDEIVVHPAAIMGDAGLVTPVGTIGPTERAKYLSPVLADIVDSARRNGYDEVLVQSLVSLGVKTWEVENTTTGQRYFLTEAEYRALFNDTPPESASPYIASGGQVDRQWQDGAQFKDEQLPRGLRQAEPARDDFVQGNPEFTPGMERDTLFRLESMATPGTTRPDFANENPDEYRYVRFVTSGDTFLTMQAQAMDELGFSRAEIRDREELRNYTSTDADRVRVYTRSFPESLAKFMTMSLYGTILSVLLIIVFLVSLFIELSAPGMGVFGTVALVALALLVVPQIMMNAAAWWMLAAILAGVCLILIEAFVTPGFGVPGVSGLALLLLGLIGSFANAGQAFPGAGASGSADQLTWAIALVLLAVFAAGAGMYLVSRYTKSIPIANKMILTTPARSDRDDMLAAMNPAASTDAPVQVGATGVATSTLRPSGSADFAGTLINVVAERGMIDKGTTVRVTDANKYRVAVLPVLEELEGPPNTDDTPTVPPNTDDLPTAPPNDDEADRS